MAIFSPAELTEQITAWKAALLAVSTGQSYTIGKRTLTRADSKEIRETLAWLQTESDKLDAGAGSGGHRMIPARPYR